MSNFYFISLTKRNYVITKDSSFLFILKILSLLLYFLFIYCEFLLHKNHRCGSIFFLSTFDQQAPPQKKDQKLTSIKFDVAPSPARSPALFQSINTGWSFLAPSRLVFLHVFRSVVLQALSCLPT